MNVSLFVSRFLADEARASRVLTNGAAAVIATGTLIALLAILFMV